MVFHFYYSFEKRFPTTDAVVQMHLLNSLSKYEKMVIII